MSYLHTSPVAATICPRCQAPILTGWAEGLRARVDPVAINRAGLITAILTSRPTYRLTRGGLVHLDQDRIGSRSIHGPMVATHRCGQPIPTEHRDTTPTATQTVTPQPEGIPY